MLVMLGLRSGGSEPSTLMSFDTRQRALLSELKQSWPWHRTRTARWFTSQFDMAACLQQIAYPEDGRIHKWGRVGAEQKFAGSKLIQWRFCFLSAKALR